MEKIKAIRTQLRQNILLGGKFDSYTKERKQIYDLLHRTVDVGESNSALLIGPRGCGKTTLVNNVIQELEELPNYETNCVTVHLNGLIHTDDKLALIAITSQMQLDNVVEDKVFGSFAENLAFLLACLRTGGRSSKSVIFIIEEFDLFSSHTNQTLLYNLFDISQSAQAPICVLGVTCRLDVIELLEKRVKSRFSHRQIFLFPGTEEHDSLAAYIELIEQFLTLKPNKQLNSKSTDEWNKSIAKLLKDKQLRTHIQRLQDVTLNYNILKNLLISIVASLNSQYPTITLSHFEDEMQKFEADEVIEQLLDLSVLEMCLLISMKHHCEIYDNQPLNFEMVYTRYAKFANGSSSVQTVQRPVVMKAYEHLIGMEFLQAVSGVGIARGQKEYTMYKLLVSKHQIMEAARRWTSLPTDVAQWAISSLI